jgi:crotonobetainyl-CoA:carnitine CoA-transferase CaiB-like acyl-CoA transferase
MTFVAPLPLEGLLVLDLSRVLAGPFATMMLADMGATVIKIEEPARGDDTRGFGPPFVEGESTYYLSFNRNKRSLAVDLKSAEGRDLVRRLALKADIVIENFRPGTVERMGLGYEELSKEKPSLVYVSVSGFGQTGPERERPGYDLMAQGMGGLMSLTGPEEGDPCKVGVSQADLVAGLYAVQGTLLALLSLQRTGRGQHVDVCLLDGQVSLLSFIAASYLNTGREPSRQGNRHASIAPYQTYEAADGHFNVAVGNDRLFEAFAREINHPELAEDPRFATNRARVANIAALNEILEPVFKRATVSEWTERLDRAKIPAGPILTVKQVLEHPQVAAREMVAEMEHPTIGVVKTVANPVRMSGTPARYELAPPLLGQHTEQILRVVLEMRDDEIAALEERSVIRQWWPSAEEEASKVEGAAAEVEAIEVPSAAADVEGRAAPLETAPGPAAEVEGHGAPLETAPQVTGPTETAREQIDGESGEAAGEESPEAVAAAPEVSE